MSKKHDTSEDPFLWLGDEELPVTEPADAPEEPAEEAPARRHAAPAKKSKKKPHTALRAVGISLLAILGVICILLGLVIWKFADVLANDPNYVSSDDEEGPDFSGASRDEVEDYEEVDLSHLEVRGNTDYVTNYLLIACDARSGETRSRSDTNMILSINDATKTIKLISLMRDSWVTIPGLGYQDKLAHAYAYGGFSLLSQTIEQNFCLQIDQAVMVNFEGFIDAVDALGGIDVELDSNVVTWIPKVDPGDPDKFACNKYGVQLREPIGYTAGTYHLEGFQALSYCRVRYAYADSDYSRQRNQRTVISSLISTAMSNPTKIYSALKNTMDDVTLYNIRQSEILDYVYNATKYLGYTIETDYTLSYRGTSSSSGLSILVLDNLEQQVTDLHQYIYSTEETVSTDATETTETDENGEQLTTEPTLSTTVTDAAGTTETAATTAVASSGSISMELVVGIAIGVIALIVLVIVLLSVYIAKQEKRSRRKRR